MFARLKPFIFVPLITTGIIAVFVYLPVDLWHLSWPTTTGTVIISTRNWHVTTQSNGRGYPEAYVAYEYAVDGNDFVSDRYDVNGPYGNVLFGGEAAVQEVLDEYPKGGQVKVYYKRDDPSFGILQPTLRRGQWIFYLSGTFVVSLLLYVNWRRWRARREARSMSNTVRDEE